MPQVQPSKAQQNTAVSVQENKTVRERLVDRFQPHEYVRVINIDDTPFSWQWFPSTGEETYFDDNGQVRIVTGRASFTKDFSARYPGNEQLWVINPGESEVLLGENAYLMIEGLYKKLVAKKKVADSPDQPQTSARNFNWNDGMMQEKMIDKIFIGVVRPEFNEPTRTAKTRA